MKRVKGGNSKIKFEFEPEKDLPEIERLGGLLSWNDLAAYFAISTSTFERMRQKHPEIYEAYYQGKAKKHEYVVSKLFENIKHNDTQSIKFYLERKAGWVDKSTNLTINNEAPKFEQLTLKFAD